MNETTRAHPQTGARDVEAIHDGTAIYTSAPEIEKLLDHLDWPTCGGDLLDPGCGNGNMVIAALSRLELSPGDFSTATRVKGIEFHRASVLEARERCRDHLIANGWSAEDADKCAQIMIEERDYLLDPPSRQWKTILSNPPYWRRSRLPETYREQYDASVSTYARGDLLHAYLDQISRNAAHEGRLGLVTSDRWLTNSGAGELRSVIGKIFKVAHVERLDSKSAFHRPKDRVKGSPPRVHAVSLVMSNHGRELNQEPFLVEPAPDVEGVSLSDLIDIRLAPWLGPDGIFMVDSEKSIPGATLVPCVMPKGIDPETNEVTAPTRWAIVTGDEAPPRAVLSHLDEHLDRMPKRGRRKLRWQPPERFDKHLPLCEDAILVPRIAKCLKAITLPAGMLPVNHSLVVASGDLGAEEIRTMLTHPLVQQQADALAPRVEGGYRSYTATLLRDLVIPYEALPSRLEKAA